LQGARLIFLFHFTTILRENRMDSHVLRMPDPKKVYRVVQWATGRIGTVSLRELIRSPQFELVGVFVHSAAKDGKDAGELCGLPPVGVKATTVIDKIIALKPDCVVAFQEGANLDSVCKFLEAGINIATSRVDYLEPDRMDPEVRRRTEAACLAGGASIHTSGASPGFASEILPLAATSMSRQMVCMTIDEFADIPASCPDVQVVDGMGFGSAITGAFNPDLLHHHAHGFMQSVNVIAKALGIELDDMKVFGEMAGAKERFLLPGGTPIEKGTLAAQRITIDGIRDGKPLIRYRINWYTTLQIDQPWKLRENGWRLVVEGDTPVEINVTFPVTKENGPTAMAGITAYPVINAVPYVVAAEPGIRRTYELPIVVPRMD
jgi:4-hydroxy-tetrahydrodipicolinate reductase